MKRIFLAGVAAGLFLGGAESAVEVRVPQLSTPHVHGDDEGLRELLGRLGGIEPAYNWMPSYVPPASPSSLSYWRVMEYSPSVQQVISAGRNQPDIVRGLLKQLLRAALKDFEGMDAREKSRFILASDTSNPDHFSEFRRRMRLIERSLYVLASMGELSWVDEELEAFLKAKISSEERCDPLNAWFVACLVAELKSKKEAVTPELVDAIAGLECKTERIAMGTAQPGVTGPPFEMLAIPAKWPKELEGREAGIFWKFEVYVAWKKERDAAKAGTQPAATGRG